MSRLWDPTPFPSAAKLHEKADWQNNFNRDNDRKKWMMPNCFQPILRFKLECVGATGAFDPEHNRQLPRAYELTEDGLKSDGGTEMAAAGMGVNVPLGGGMALVSDANGRRGRHGSSSEAAY